VIEKIGHIVEVARGGYAVVVAAPPAAEGRLLVAPVKRRRPGDSDKEGVTFGDADLREGRLGGENAIRLDLVTTVAAAEPGGRTAAVLSADKTAEMLKKWTLAAAAQYYGAVHEPALRRPFVPGESRVPYAGRVFDEKEIVNLVDSGLEFWLTAGRYCRQFERRLAEIVGVRHCCLVSSGSSANLLAAAALTSPKLGDRRLVAGDEVITVAAGFPTTINPILQLGLVPVFVDIELGTYNVDAALLDQALTPRTKAVVLAHTLGNPFDLDAVTAFCRKHGLWLLEDNCDALGSTYKGKMTGSFGDVATSSFYPPHHITTGEGGAVYTDNDRIDAAVESLRDWGRDCRCPPGRDNTCGRRFEMQLGELPKGYDHKYIYSHFGYNLKATDMQAAVGCAQLDKLAGFAAARRRNWNVLSEGLEDLADAFILPVATAGSEPSWFGFMLTVRDRRLGRDGIVRHLESKNIQTRMLFAGNYTRHPAFDDIRGGGAYRVAGDLANTDRVMNDSFWVGVYPGLSDAMLEYVIETIRGGF
jgi:CDP-6-deoxy-D-xylo-4-hexulose-3-dehydrase